MNRLESRIIEAAGFRIHLREWRERANGPTVVLVPGAGMLGRYMVPMAEVLAGEWPVMTIDFPGFGKSERPGRALPMSELADVLGACLEVAEVRDPVLFGNSFGCRIAVDFASRNPGRVRGLVLHAPTVRWAEEVACLLLHGCLKTIEKGSHGIILTDPRKLFECAAPFLRELDSQFVRRLNEKKSA